MTAVVKSLNQAEQLFGLSRTTDLRFFPEWQSPNVELTPGEEAALDRIKTSYLYNSADGPLTERTINLQITAPLLIYGEIPTCSHRKISVSDSYL